MIAFYMRLSLSDGDLSRDESMSIENQRRYMRDLVSADSKLSAEAAAHSVIGIKDKDIVSNFEDKSGKKYTVLEFVDDGYSGTSFDRPAFKNMLRLCRAGIVTVVIVKDLSRFGRNYIDVGDYIERLFPMLGIRFIAAANSYDSASVHSSENELDMEITNLMNAFYSRDLSRKQRATRQFKWSRGISTAACVPYGYLKDSENKGKWKIDPEAAKIIRLIFKRAAEGERTSETAELLNAMNVPTPGEYGKEHGLWKNLNTTKAPKSERLWTHNTVLGILKRYEYTGALVSGKKSRIGVGSAAPLRSSKQNMIIIENVNEPIVSREEFKKAEAMRTKYLHSPRREALNYPLRSKVRCFNCRLAMTYSPIYKSFFCAHGHEAGRFSSCPKDLYDSKRLAEVVLYSLKLIDAALNNASGGAEEDATGQKSLAVRRRSAKSKLSTENAEKMRLFEAYAEDRITPDEYKERVSRIENEHKHKSSALEIHGSDTPRDNDPLKTLSDKYLTSVYIRSHDDIELELCVPNTANSDNVKNFSARTC